MDATQLNTEILTIKALIRTAHDSLKDAIARIEPIKADVAADSGIDSSDIMRALTEAEELLQDGRDFLHHQEILATTAAQDAA